MPQDKPNNPDEQSRVLLNKAREAYDEGKKETALRLAIEGLKLDSSDKLGSALNRMIATILSGWGELSLATPYAEKALKLARQTGKDSLIYRGMMIVGRIKARMNLYDEAMASWKGAMKYCEKETKAQARLHVNMAILEQRRGRHEEAFKMLARAKELADEVQDNQTIAVYFSRMVYSHCELGNYDEASIYLAELERNAKESGSRELLAMARFRRGSIHQMREEYSKAIEPLQDAADIFAELGDKKNYAQALCELARAYIATGKLNRVDSIMFDAISVAEGIDSDYGMSAVYLVLAELSACRGNIERVVYYYRESLRLACRIGSEDRFRAFHESLAEMLKKLGFALPGLRSLLGKARESYIKLGLKKELEELSPWLERVPGDI